MRSAILARHGETTFNLHGAVNGDPLVGCPLTPQGEEQARRLGRLLARERIDACVTTAFERARRTSELALQGRRVDLVVVAELGDPDYGAFEGRPLEEYRAWARSSPSSAEPPGGGESRRTIVDRYVSGFRAVLRRPEERVLVVAHSLPVAYALAARAGEAPGPHVPLVEYAHPYRFSADELGRAVELLAAWVESPTW